MQFSVVSLLQSLLLASRKCKHLVWQVSEAGSWGQVVVLLVATCVIVPHTTVSFPLKERNETSGRAFIAHVTFFDCVPPSVVLPDL